MKLSIVATLYQSSSHIDEFYQRMSATAGKLVGEDYEIVFVNDGSPDNSLEIAIEITQEDSHVVVIDLSRNFGHHKAMMTGLAHTKGEMVFLIDTDLEESPEWLITFNEQMQGDASYDVIFGMQESRKGGFFEKYSGALFWSILDRLSGLSLPANQVTARLMSRRYVNGLLSHEEREIFMAGLWQITGFKQMPVSVHKFSKSPSTYTIGRKLSLLVNSITSFSVLPLIGIFYIGLFIFSFACCYTVYLVVSMLFFSYTLAGWTSVMVSIWLIGGLILSGMGIIGIYLSKVFSEVKRRPYTIIRDIYGR